jgi:hypothetical protein
MKITLELLEKCGVCGDAYDWSSKAFPNSSEETFEKGKEKLLEHLKTLPAQVASAWLNWYDSLLINPVAVKFYNDWSYTGKYSFINLINNIRSKEYTSENEMLDDYNIEKNIIMQQYLDSMSINEHINNEDNTTTWKPVDIKNLIDEAEYQVFNPMLGTHKFCATLQETKDEILNIQNNYVNIMLKKEKQITNPDGNYAWDSY